MLHQLHRLRLAFGLGLVLAAVAAAPSGAFILRAYPSTAPGTHPTTGPCSEVCSGGVAGLSSAVPLDPWVHNVVTQSPVTTHPAPPTVVRVVAHDDGFDWGDAAIGAGVAAAILLIVVGGATATTTRRGRSLGGSSATVAG